MKYRLGDLVIKDWNSWDRVPRDPISIGTAIASAIGVTSVVGTYAIIGLTYVGISAVTSWAISALAPKPDFSSFGSQGTLVNTRDAAAAADFVYGEVRKGGTVTYYESTGDDNKFLHQIIVLAGHEVAEIGDIYINEEVVTLDSNGYVTDAEWVIDGGANPSGIRIQKFLGDQTAAPADLLSESELTGGDALDSNFVGRGIAYLYVRYEFDQTVFASGVPLITAKVKGKKVYDPRTATTGYSNNAALCIRDFITSEYGLNDSAVDDVVFSAAANESDENVTLSGSGTEKRYTINGIIKASSPTGKVLGEMATACAGTLFWGSGYWKLKVGAYSAPVKTLTLDDLRGPINLSTRSSMRDSFNGVTGTFNDASADFITADYPPIKSSTFQTEDGGDELLLDLPLPFTTSAATAQRIAKMTLYRGREQMTISADFGLEAFNVEVGDIIAFTNERYGFDEKEFEVIGWRFESNQEAGDLRVNLTLQETSEAAFAWSAEESEIIGNNTNLPVANAGLVVNNLTASDSTRLQGDGTTVNSAILAWTAVSSSFFSYYDVEWKQTSDSTYASTTTTENGIEVSPLIDGVEYTFRVRAVSVTGATGSYATVTLTSGGDTTAPSAPTSVSADGGFGTVNVSWVNPADTDLSFARIYESVDNNVVNATLVGSASGDNFIRANLSPEVTRYYWVSAVDYSGNESGKAGPASATTSQITAADIGPAVIGYDDFASDVTALFDGIASDFTQVEADLVTINNSIGQLTTDTVALQSDVTTLQTDYTTLDGEVTTNTNALSGLETRVTNAEGTITSNSSSITSLQTDLTSAEGDITANTSAISGLDTRVTSAEGTITSNSSSITSLQTDLTNVEGDITANTSAISGLDTRVTSAEGTITSNSSAITSLQSSLTNAESDITANATAVSGLDTRVTDNEGDISSQASQITSLSTTVGDNTTTISQVSQSVDGIEGKYGVTIDSNGSITGYQLLSGAGGSAFNVRADQFAVFNSTGGGGDNPFTVFTSSRTIDGVVYPAGTYIENAYIDNVAIVEGSITTAKIGDLQVDTIKVADRAITSQTAVTTSGSATSPFYTTLGTLTFSASANEQVLVGAGMEIELDATGQNGAYFDYRVTFNGTSFGESNIENSTDTRVNKNDTFILSGLTVSGANTLLVQARKRSGSGTVTIDSSIFALEALK